MYCYVRWFQKHSFNCELRIREQKHDCYPTLIPPFNIIWKTAKKKKTWLSTPLKKKKKKTENEQEKQNLITQINENTDDKIHYNNKNNKGMNKTQIGIFQ